MTERGLRALHPTTYAPRTVFSPRNPTSLGHLCDITFIRTANGWLYPAVVIDLCSRKIIDWSLADHVRAQLVTDTLQQALGSRLATRRTIFHSDRVGQY